MQSLFNSSTRLCMRLSGQGSRQVLCSLRKKWDSDSAVSFCLPKPFSTGSETALAPRILSTTTVAGGELIRFTHDSVSTKTPMTASVFLPPGSGTLETLKEKTSSGGLGVPALYWLSGLTCTDENFSTKSGAFLHAAREKIAVVVPDTSPRGAGVPGEDDSYDIGTGAGFYVDATEAPWSTHYRMYAYITKELPELVQTHFGISPSVRSISGHSMGGHGALTIAMKDKGETWAAVSAFAPICHPSTCGWGKKAFETYLGSVAAGEAHDATLLMNKQGPFPKLGEILIDQGSDDKFLHEGQLQPEALKAACKAKGQTVSVRMSKGDHSYYFISSFMEDHVKFHARALRKKAAQVRSQQKETTTPAVPKDAPSSDTAGKPITCKAMVAHKPKEPLTCEEVVVAPPRAGEVRVRVVANALCHTDVYTWEGSDPEGIFPSILGHEAGCVVESVGEGVTNVQPGDHVIPCYTPQCGEPDCIFCQSSQTNLCPRIRATQGKGVMPDGTSRFSLKRDGTPISHFMGCSTFSEYSVISAISAAKISKDASLEKVCLLGCGVATGWGAVWNTCKVPQGSSVAVFGCGAVGLAVLQAAKASGAGRVIAVDTNPDKFPVARAMGATECVDPTKSDGPIQQEIVRMTGWGVDFTFDCTGNTEVMRAALESAHRGWGVSCVIGVAAAGKEISTRPFQLVTGRKWCGTAFGGWKSRADVPKLVDRVMDGQLDLEPYITHVFRGVESTNKAFDALHSGDCLRAVVVY